MTARKTDREDREDREDWERIRNGLLLKLWLTDKEIQDMPMWCWMVIGMIFTVWLLVLVLALF